MVRYKKSRRRELRIAYTNVNGLLSGLLELNDFLRESQPDIMGITETKLCDEMESVDLGENKYNVWMRNRNTKKGVLILVKKELKVDNIIYGEGRAEILKVGVKQSGGSRRDFVVGYVPPKTNSWTRDEYEQMTKDTIMCLKRLVIESENVTIMGDFNCKEVSWENLSTEGSELSWGNKLLQLAMNNVQSWARYWISGSPVPLLRTSKHR